MQDLSSHYYYSLIHQRQQPLLYNFNQIQASQIQGNFPITLQMPINTSPYSNCYQNIKEILYFEQGDGEIFIYYDLYMKQPKMVTCIDISTLYKEKRGKAIDLASFMCQLKHKNLIHIYRYQVYEERLIYIEMEVPLNLTTWKTFCKKKFSNEEIFNVLKQVTEGIEYLHQQNIVHRDIHPSRIQCFQNNVIKFNHIGLPYNFKKLLKRENFSGHINYSAPELILEKENFNLKVDVWALGCCLFYMLFKKDPFEGKDPNEIKNNIINGKYDQVQNSNIPLILKPIIEACFNIDENNRSDSTQLIKLISQLQAQLKLQQKHINKQLKEGLVCKSKTQESKVINTSFNTNNQKVNQSKLQNLNINYKDKYQQEAQLSLFNQNILQKNDVQINSEIQTQTLGSSSDDANLSNCTDETVSSNKTQHQFYLNESENQDIQVYSSQPMVHYDIEGNIYEGSYKNGRKHGQGKQIFINGDVYTGQWENGKMHGEGKLIFNSGVIYTGQFMYNLKHGQGVLLFTTTGDCYVGQWKNDKMTGKGKYTYFEEQKTYEGEFVEGAPYGFGIMSCKDFYYKGYFKSGLFEGQGELEDFANYIIFKGEYFDGYKKGYGILHDLKTGDIFQGSWNRDMRNGKGKLISVKEKQIIEGIWEQDELKTIESCTQIEQNIKQKEE